MKDTKELDWNLFSKACEQHESQAYANRLWGLYNEGIESRIQVIPKHHYENKTVYTQGNLEGSLQGETITDLIGNFEKALRDSIEEEDLLAYPDGIDLWLEGCECTLRKKIPVSDNIINRITEDNDFWRKMQNKLERILVTYEELEETKKEDYKTSLQRRIEELQEEMENL